MGMVTMNVIDPAMESICREMAILLMKTLYSTICNEGLDCPSRPRPPCDCGTIPAAAIRRPPIERR